MLDQIENCIKNRELKIKIVSVREINDDIICLIHDILPRVRWNMIELMISDNHEDVQEIIKASVIHTEISMCHEYVTHEYFVFDKELIDWMINEVGIKGFINYLLYIDLSTLYRLNTKRIASGKPVTYKRHAKDVTYESRCLYFPDEDSESEKSEDNKDEDSESEKK